MSRHHRAAKWSTLAKKARPRLAATLPRPCSHCGKPVLPGQQWDIAHRGDLALGGDLHTYAVAHAACNRRAGGKLGAAMSRAPRAVRATSKREPRW